MSRRELPLRFEGLDLNLLVALDALLSECSVSAAAERLRLSQPATSGALSRLREYFRDELLVMSGRRMIPTPRAAMLVEPIRAALQQIQTTILSPPVFDPLNCQRRFVIEASDYVTELILIPMAVRLASLAPKMTLQFQSRGEVGDMALDSGLTDLSILPDIFAVPSHETELLFTDDFVLVGDARNAALDAPMTVDLLYSLGHVTTVFGRNRALSFADMTLPREHQIRRVEVSASRFTDALRMVVGTERVAIAHRSLALSYARQLPIRLAELPFELPAFREVLQYQTLRRDDSALQWLRGVLQDQVASMRTDLYKR